VALALCLLPAAAWAQFAPLDEVQVHGFVSQGFLKSTANNFIGYSHRGTLNFTEGAVNVSSQLGDTLSTGIQLFADRLGPQGGFNARFDWFNLDWRPLGWLNIRAGRIKLPFGLYNEGSDYDPGRLTVLLPQSIYPLTSRNFLLAANGGELYGYISLPARNSLSYAVVGGSSFLDTPPETTVTVPYTVAGRILWEPPVFGLRIGASILATELDFSTPGASGAPVTGSLPALLWVASAEYQQGHLKVAAEYSRWHTKIESDDPAEFPESDTTSERAYVSGEYSISGPLAAGVYYSVVFPDVDERTGGPGHYSHDVAATLRYDITSHLFFKLEAHFLHGTAGLTPALNGGKPIDSLVEDWGLLTGKLTAFF
jgi:hypothetical protein